MTSTRTAPHVQPSPRMWQILRRCYRGQNPIAVLERALDLLAGADGHLTPDGRIQTAREVERARRLA